MTRRSDEWRHWLAAHHAQPTGVWLVAFKKSADPKR